MTDISWRIQYASNPLTSSWPHLRGDVGLEEGEYYKNKKEMSQDRAQWRRKISDWSSADANLHRGRSTSEWVSDWNQINFFKSIGTAQIARIRFDDHMIWRYSQKETPEFLQRRSTWTVSSFCFISASMSCFALTSRSCPSMRRTSGFISM